MLPQPPFHWGIVTDTRHKFYRVQIPFCVASCPNCTLECLLTAPFFLACCCRQSPLRLSRVAQLSVVHSSIGLLPAHPPTLLSSVVSKPDTWAFVLLLWKWDSFSSLQRRQGKPALSRTLLLFCSPRVGSVQVPIIFNNQPVLRQIFQHPSPFSKVRGVADRTQ